MSKSQTLQDAVIHEDTLALIKELQEGNNEKLKGWQKSLTDAVDKVIILADLYGRFEGDTEIILADLVSIKKDMLVLSSKKGGELC